MGTLGKKVCLFRDSPSPLFKRVCGAFPPPSSFSSPLISSISLSLTSANARRRSGDRGLAGRRIDRRDPRQLDRLRPVHRNPSQGRRWPLRRVPDCPLGCYTLQPRRRLPRSGLLPSIYWGDFYSRRFLVLLRSFDFFFFFFSLVVQLIEKCRRFKWFDNSNE